MMSDRYFDWHSFDADDRSALTPVDSLRRLRICFVAFLVLVAIVLGRVAQLEATSGKAFRTEATRPLVQQKSLAGVRGRIIGRDGTILTHNKKVLAVAVRYRYLQQPHNSRWLRRLAKLCGMSLDEWTRRARRIQTRVERIATNVNRRRQKRFEQRQVEKESIPKSESSLQWMTRHVLDILNGSVDELPPRDVVVAEELDYHVMAEDVSSNVMAEIQTHPKKYPGVKIVERSRRAYPAGCLASHVLGHLGRPKKHELDTNNPAAYHPNDRIGRTGLERQYEDVLRGRRGMATQQIDRKRRILSSYRQCEPGTGRDLILTLDPMLQRTAENLLADALTRRSLSKKHTESAGGAVIVMNVQTGAILTAASAPSFDPNLLSGGARSADVAEVLEAKDHPLFNRITQMAIPPGSVFKTLSAVALLEAASLDPEESFFCQGYLEESDRLRCAVYIQHGVGHGEVSLYDALGQSCNVYFFHHAIKLGPRPIVDWAHRFGLGRPTGIDLPNEASGNVPNPRRRGRKWRTADTQSMIIGQGDLTTTPMQIVRMMAAVANGGKLVHPHLVADRAKLNDQIKIPTPRQIPGLKRSTLAIVRRGLEQTVSDPNGTAYGTVHMESIAVAGKTGTAQVGKDRSDHAWFAGYVPADKPKYAFVVVLEHSGNGGQSAGPVAKRLVQRMQQLDML